MSQLQNWTRRRNWAKFQLMGAIANLTEVAMSTILEGHPSHSEEYDPASEQSRIVDALTLLGYITAGWKETTCQLKKNLPKTSS